MHKKYNDSWVTCEMLKAWCDNCQAIITFDVFYECENCNVYDLCQTCYKNQDILKSHEHNKFEEIQNTIDYGQIIIDKILTKTRYKR